MTVGQMIEELQKHDPNKPIMIQQGEEWDYMTAESVLAKEIITNDYFTDEDGDEDLLAVEAVVIEYC